MKADVQVVPVLGNTFNGSQQGDVNNIPFVMLITFIILATWNTLHH